MSHTRASIHSHIRSKLGPFLGEESPVVGPTHAAHFTNPREIRSRFVQKIPRKNYDDLPKMVPISWL